MIKFLKKGFGLDRNVTVVIRSIGERTEATCVNLLQQQINSRNLHLIHKTPFHAALIESFNIGLKEKRKWTLVIDADVLVKSGILQGLYSRTEAEPSSVFAVQTEMLDKFFGGTRVGGIKIYRTELLYEALKFVSDDKIRPEAHIIKTMHKRGYYVDITNLICGIHDFEQYYADIFRKGFVHGVKHAEIAKLLLPYWRRMAKTDKDFTVLHAGYQASRHNSGNLALDKDETKPYFNSFKRLSKLPEKNNIISSAMNSENINNTINNWAAPVEYEYIKAQIEKKGRPEIPIGVKK